MSSGLSRVGLRRNEPNMHPKRSVHDHGHQVQALGWLRRCSCTRIASLTLLPPFWPDEARIMEFSLVFHRYHLSCHKKGAHCAYALKRHLSDGQDQSASAPNVEIHLPPFIHFHRPSAKTGYQTWCISDMQKSVSFVVHAYGD